MINISLENFLLLKQSPASKAIISSSSNYTFDELRKKVSGTAAFLKRNKILNGDRVGIIGSNSSDFVINILALWQISAVPVTLNARLTGTEINEQLNRTDCSCILVQKEFLEKFDFTDKNQLLFPFVIDEDNFRNDRTEINPEETAVIIFTSGSTQKSKGVVLSFGSLFNSAINGNHLLRYTLSDKWCASLPFYHIGGFSIITRSLLFGIPLVFPDSLSNDDLSAALHRWQPTYISLVSPQVKRFVAENISPNPELKNCLIGGGFSDTQIIKAAYDLGWPINIVYGSTETASFVTALLKEEINIKPNSVGRAVPTNRILIVDEEGNEQKPFEIGEVKIQSNSILSGYIDEKNSQINDDGFYLSGDQGYLDEDGYLFLTGRKNYLISTGGENVNPEEVEKALLNHPSISEAAVFPLEDEEWGEIVSAVIILKNKSDRVSVEEVRKFLVGKISSFKIPKRIYIEKELPKTELGKIEKQKLIERYKLTSR